MPLTGRPDYLFGDLSLIGGTLNIDAGTGRQTLMISDEAGQAARTALITRDKNAAAALEGRTTNPDTRLRSANELQANAMYVVGLANRAITYRTDGNFADGIWIWSGYGADTLTVNDTWRTAGVRTVTWLNTGLGNDDVTVALSPAKDDMLVLNTQGAYNQNVRTVSLYGGDDLRPGDVVQGVTIGGTAVGGGRFEGNAGANTVGLFDSGVWAGTTWAPIGVRVLRTYVETAVLAAQSTLTLVTTLQSGDSVTATVNGITKAVQVNGQQLTFTGGPVTGFVVVSIARTSLESPSPGSSFATDADDDRVHGPALDAAAGDLRRPGRRRHRRRHRRRRHRRRPWPGALVRRHEHPGGRPRQRAAHRRQPGCPRGCRGPRRRSRGARRQDRRRHRSLIGLVLTTDPRVGGNDTITTGTGRDTILGGAGNDTITSNRGVGGDPTVDSSDIVLGDHGFVDSVLRDGQATDLDRIWSTDTDLGGNDLIRTGEGDDVVVAGVGNDTVDAGNGLNVVIGDSGRITSAVQDTARRGALPMTLGRVETVDPTLGGSDTILTGSGSDIVLGGAAGDTISTDTNAAVDATDIVLGDHGYLDFVADLDATDIDAIVSTDVDLGGNDVICTGTGSVSANMAASCGGSLPGDGADVVFGGAGDDTVFAGTGHNIVLGDNGSLTAYDAVTARWGTLPMSPQTLVTLASAADGNDVVTTLSGVDVVLGGNGDDFARLGAGTDTFVGDRAEVTWAVPTTNNPSGTLQVVKVQVIDNTVGGADLAYGEADDDLLVGGTRDDDLDGGSGRDLVIGDNAVLDRTTRYGVYTSPRFRTLLTPGGAIYSTALATAGTAQVDGTSRLDPRGNAVWADYVLTLLDHAVGSRPAALRRRLHRRRRGRRPDLRPARQRHHPGRRRIDRPAPDATDRRAATRLLTMQRRHRRTMLGAADGDDYIEGNGGNDVVFGGLGQDDIIGGSSDFFGLTTASQRPDGTDMLFGGAGTRGRPQRRRRTDAHGTRRRHDRRRQRPHHPHRRHQRRRRRRRPRSTSRSSTTTTATGAAARRPRRHAARLHAGRPDFEPTLFRHDQPRRDVGAMTVDIWRRRRVHGEAGDDTVYAGGGNDVVFGDAGTTTSSAAGATTGSPAAPARTASSATTAASSPAATGHRRRAALRHRPAAGDRRRRPASATATSSTSSSTRRARCRRRRSTSPTPEQGRRPHAVQPRPERVGGDDPLFRRLLRRRHHLRRPGQRLPARRLRRRRDLRRRGAGRVPTRQRYSSTGALVGVDRTDWITPYNPGDVLRSATTPTRGTRAAEPRRRVRALRRVRPAPHDPAQRRRHRCKHRPAPACNWFLNVDADRRAAGQRLRAPSDQRRHRPRVRHRAPTATT